jgi:hypothetical protein
MRSIQDTRLECLKLASALAHGKIIKADEVQTRAEAYFNWVVQGDTEKPSDEQMDGLRSLFAK